MSIKENKIKAFTCFSIAIMSFNVFAGQQALSEKNMKLLENEFGGRIGVFAINTSTGKTFGYRENERFPLCSSFKGFLAAAMLVKSQSKSDILNEVVKYPDREMEPHSPITGKYKSTGMTAGDMAAAALQYSDNGAANMLMEKYIGGPAGMTAFMRSLGDKQFRLDRWELELNSAIPGDERDTSTPEAVARSLNTLAQGDVLKPEQKQQFFEWLKGNTTGDARIRASTPANWIVGDKTGTCGFYGTANDYAIVWPESKDPIIVSVYTTKGKVKDDKHSDAAIEEASRIAIKSVTQ